MELIPIHKTLDDNQAFVDDALCAETLFMTINFFTKVGHNPPWIGYYVKDKDHIVGSCAYKGAPVNGTVEIAYGTFEPYRQKGIGTRICKLLVDLALKTDPRVRVTARTSAKENFSTRILQKNGFYFSQIVDDPEDGEVWEWEYMG
jgi:[ribosomal protein S5]-alanine N-acetyltransferase